MVFDISASGLHACNTVWLHIREQGVSSHAGETLLRQDYCQHDTRSTSLCDRGLCLEVADTPIAQTRV